VTGGARPQLWRCPRCGRTFANVNQTHTCAALGDVHAAFARSGAAVRAAFDRAVDVIRAVGDVEVLAERSRVALHVRMSFAAFQPRRSWLDGHLVLARRASHPSFQRIEVFSARNVLHAFRLAVPADLDAPFAALLLEAYGVGNQRHLGPEPDGAARRALTDQLLVLERALATRATADAPNRDLAALLADPFLEFGASGRRWDRAATVDALRTPSDAHVTIEEFQVRLVGPDLAVATYDLTADGRRSARTSAWLRQNGRWRIAFHQGTFA
jgi:hypothetical protein